MRRIPGDANGGRAAQSNVDEEEKREECALVDVSHTNDEINSSEARLARLKQDFEKTRAENPDDVQLLSWLAAEIAAHIDRMIGDRVEAGIFRPPSRPGSESVMDESTSSSQPGNAS